MTEESLRLQEVKVLVDETVHIMNNNVRVLFEREAKLTELNDRAEDLQDSALHFQAQNRKLRTKYWWENYVFITIICVLLFIFSVSVIIWGTESQE